MDDLLYHSSSWLSKEESSSECDSNSEEEISDSDKIDSDIEIELYSQLHCSADMDPNVSINKLTEDSFPRNVNTSYSSKFDENCEIFANASVSAESNVIVSDLISKDSTAQSMSSGLFSDDSNLEEGYELSANRGLGLIGVKRKIAESAKEKTPKEESYKPSKVTYMTSDSDDSVICIDSDDDSSGKMLSNISYNHLGNERENSRCTNNSLETNVVCIDSSNSSSDSSLNERITMFHTPRTFFKTSTVSSSTPISEITQNGSQWHVNHDDLYSHIKPQSRYHEKQNSMCSNCKKKGHTAKTCQEARQVKCYICGGDHPWIICKNQICGKCYQDGHIAKHCRYRSREIRCGLCRMKGHIDKGCPDLWRRYHLTTTPHAIVKGARDSKRAAKYCYNCGHKGHFGHECPKPRMSPDTYPTWPFVVSYKNPKKIFQRHHFGKTRQRENERTEENERTSRRHSYSPQVERTNGLFELHGIGMNSEKSRRQLANSKSYAHVNYQSNTFHFFNGSVSYTEPYFPRTPKTKNDISGRKFKKNGKYHKSKQKQSTSKKEGKLI